MTRIHTRAARPKQAGFTIIELMVSITVLGVLLGVGVPAFNDLIRNNRLATQANAIVGALNYARGETATRGIPIAICAASATQGECSDDEADWANGWIVFTDRSGTVGVIDGTDQVLQTGSGLSGGFSITTAQSFVRFGIGAQPTTELTFTIRPLDSRYCASTGQRRVSVSVTGRINTSKSTC
jgi:type IV fimbrial biogenesis protein FimT